MDVLHVKWLLYYRRCLFSVLWLYVWYNWQVMAPNTHHSLFMISHLYVLICVTWKLQIIYRHSAYQTTAVLSETFFVWIRAEWESRLESCGPRHASVVLWYNIVCIYCKPVYTCTSLIGVQLHMTTKLTYLMTAYYTLNNGFTANDASFYKNKVW